MPNDEQVVVFAAHFFADRFQKLTLVIRQCVIGYVISRLAKVIEIIEASMTIAYANP